jgi:hypothetical protein
MQCMFDVPKDLLHSSPMNRYGQVQVLTHFVDGEGQVRSGVRQVLQGTNNTTVFCCLFGSERITHTSSKLL